MQQIENLIWIVLTLHPQKGHLSTAILQQRHTIMADKTMGLT